MKQELVVKSKLPPQSGSVALRQLNPIHKKEAIKKKKILCSPSNSRYFGNSQKGIQLIYQQEFIQALYQYQYSDIDYQISILRKQKSNKNCLVYLERALITLFLPSGVISDVKSPYKKGKRDLKNKMIRSPKTGKDQAI